MKKHNKKYAKRMTKRQWNKNSQIMVLLAVCLSAAIIGYSGQKQAFNEPVKQGKVLTHRLPVNGNKKILTVQDKISIAATKAGINIHTALAIASCESGFQPRVRNQQGSTATGVFQFTARTWFDYCEGDVKNADDNIACFAKLYPKHNSWWACHNIVLARK